MPIKRTDVKAQIVAKLQHYAKQIENGTFEVVRCKQETETDGKKERFVTHLNLTLATQTDPIELYEDNHLIRLHSYLNEQYIYLDKDVNQADRDALGELFMDFGAKSVTFRDNPAMASFITLVILSVAPTKSEFQWAQKMYRNAAIFSLPQLEVLMGSTYATEMARIKAELAKTPK